jgi:hypothetical protein
LRESLRPLEFDKKPKATKAQLPNSKASKYD